MRERVTGPVVWVLLLASVLAACGDDGGGEEAGASTSTSSSTTSSTSAATSTSTSTSVPDTTTSSASVPTTTVAPGGCPDEAPIPADATDVQTAPVAYDGDGDGADDVLSTFRYEGQWWVQVAWASGGTGAVTVDGADMGARPLGGHDLDGDGSDEAWVAIAGPASGSIVGVYRQQGCGLWPVLDSGSGQPFQFPVTATIGTFSGASCGAIGDIALISGELVDEDTGLYEAGEVPYEYDPATGQVTAGFGDGGSVEFDEVGGLATLDCGSLAAAL